MLRGEVLEAWRELRENFTEFKNLLEGEEIVSHCPEFGDNSKTRLVSIKDPTNRLITINLTNLNSLKKLSLKYSPTHWPSLTNLTIKNCSGYLSYNQKTDFSCLWEKNKYFSQVRNLSLHYLPLSYFPKKVIDFSAYSSLERLEVELTDYLEKGYEKIIFNSSNLKILNWKGGKHIAQILGLEQCKSLEIVKIKDATVSKETGEVLKQHPRYQWAKKHLGEDSWEWVIESEGGPTIEEVE